MRKSIALCVVVIGVILLAVMFGRSTAHAEGGFDESDFKGVYVGVSSGATDRVAVWRFEANGSGGGLYLVSSHPTSSHAASIRYLVSPDGEIQILGVLAADAELFVRGHLVDHGRELYGVVTAPVAWGVADAFARTIELVRQ